ncbi:putative disease resistance RPP13-like protein 1 [Vitis vinifera]|uniref:Putative disease resistance RPP13-like protein 1 n=1 Tax=Vitis vinifera TaxID=29760 RepID=A0A438H6B8_VITVI|nr:putative disease resistance RPP13-like protein 1 [Vitis vinifera]
MAGAVAGGGALLSASLQVIFDRMASRDVLTFLRGQKLSATLLRKLQMKLLEVQAVLNDAEAKQITNLAVKDWVDELKDAVYDAEDLVDDITTEALRRKMESDSQTQVRNIIFGEGIESRVEEITDTLEYLSQKKDVLGLKKGVGENLSKRWPTTSLVDESGVYGRDVNREEIVKFLLSHNTSGNKISVIALVGMGGIGKTTLAKLVQLILGLPDDNDLNLIQHKLEERLTRKKFLLVLDDVWNEDYNDGIRYKLHSMLVYMADSKMNEITEKLRHLSYFRSEYDRFERFEILNEVNSLRTFLPLNLEIWPREDKVSKRTYPYGSRHSKVKEMPSHMGQLKSLQKLSNYIVGKQSETRVGELRELCHIGGSLVIQELQNVVDAKDASEANMVGKQYLDELELEWNRDWFGGPSILNMVSLRLWNWYAKMEGMVVHGRPRWRIPSSQGALYNGLSPANWGLTNPSAFLDETMDKECEQLVAPLPRVPAIRQLVTRSCDISQWKELPPLLKDLSFKFRLFRVPTGGGMCKMAMLHLLIGLRIRGCPNLVSIELLALNVSKYSIFNSKNLKRLLHNAACFQSLIIEGCPELIFPIQGEDWHHIAYIPHIAIDDQVLSSVMLHSGSDQLISQAALQAFDPCSVNNSSCLAMISNGTIFLLSSSLMEIESGVCSRLYDSN